MSSSDRRTDRRTIVKGAAWAAPAIVVMSAAPAFAVTGVSVRVVPASAIPTTTVTTPVPGVRITASIMNNGTVAVTALTVNVSVTLTSGAFGTIVSGSATGFGPAVVSGSGATRNFAFTAVAPTVPLAANGSVNFVPTLTSNLTSSVTGTFTITPVPTPTGPGAAGAGSF